MDGDETLGWYGNMCIHQVGVEQNQAASFLHPPTAQENPLTAAILFLFAATNA